MFRRKKFVTAIIVAAGSSQRMGEDKILMEIGGKAVILHSLHAFEDSDSIREIVLVCNQEKMELLASLGRKNNITKLSTVVRGGETRTESVENGLRAISSRAKYVAIHDGARPLVTQAAIRDAVTRGVRFHAAAPAVAVKSTIKQARSSVVISTPNRDELFEVQTPQVFDVNLIKGAIAKGKKEGISLTDDCAAVEAIGGTVHLTKGSYENIKLTTAEDVYYAEALLARREAKK